MSDLGVPLVDDEYYRPMHPMIEAYISACLRDPEMLDDNESTGILCDDSLHSLSEQMKRMMSDWGQQVWPQAAERALIKPTSRERSSVPHAARNPDIIHNCNLANKNPITLNLDPHARARSESSWNQEAKTHRGKELQHRLSREWPL